MNTSVDTLEKSVTDSLRELADFIDEHPEFERLLKHQRFLQPYSDPTEFAAAVRSLGGQREKYSDEKYFGVSRFFGGENGIELYLYIQRDEVCEAKVVGQETVEVPDPDAPKVTITRDVIEWECKPVLTGDKAVTV